MARTLSSPGSDFARMLTGLARAGAFPAEAHMAPGEPVTTIQTHASAVLLAGGYAYKLKKPVDMGFLDYSTAEKRRAFCLEEVRVNRPLAASIYLGVAPVLQGQKGVVHFGPVVTPNEAPGIGAMRDGDAVVDLAVVMRRLPEERTLAAQVRRGEATLELLERIAGAVARFHGPATPSGVEPATRLDRALANISQTVSQSAAHIGGTVTDALYTRIATFLTRFMSERRPLLTSRYADGWERDGHGDLRMEHIYLMPGDELEEPRLAIIDRIEFDPDFRRGDVASEVAFLAIELECAGRADLSRAFTRAYGDAMRDESLEEVLPFYKSYRALVRGHVRSLLLEQAALEPIERAKVSAEAKEMFALAGHYASAPVTSTIAMTGGLMGTGKSALANALSAKTGWYVYSSDVLRKRLAGLAPAEAVSASDSARIYTPTWDRRVYERMVAEARFRLAAGHSVILDASFGKQEWRRMAARLAGECGAHALFLECVCPPAVALARLQTRWDAKRRLTQAGSARSVTDPTLASDGRPSLYAKQVERWRPLTAHEVAALERTVITTEKPLSQTLERALAALRIPRLTCDLDV